MENMPEKYPSEFEFNTLVFKWIHHDNLLNARERHAFTMHAFLIATCAFLHESGLGHIAALILIGLPYFMLLYFNKAQSIDWHYRNSYDNLLAAYVKNNLQPYLKQPSDVDSDDEGESWSRGFQPHDPPRRALKPECFEMLRSTLLSGKERSQARETLNPIAQFIDGLIDFLTGSQREGNTLERFRRRLLFVIVSFELCLGILIGAIELYRFLHS